MTIRKTPTFCALCISRCGAIATVDDGRFVSLEADPAHPTGQALCVKGKAAPELVYHPDRLTHPLRRTRPKGDPDPGWERIGWDEALGEVARRLRALASEHGAESVAFSCASPSTSALSDSVDWIERLRRAFGSPNFVISMELCGWGRYLASLYTFGTSVPGVYLPDLENAGCILYWGYNPSVARLSHATATVAALGRGAKLVVVDPRRAGLAHRAHHWLRVRPGTDAALALAIAHVMLERGWFDEPFVRRWTNGPLLVRDDDGRLLRERDLTPGGAENRYVAWNRASARPVVYDPATGRYETADDGSLALFGEVEVRAGSGTVRCRPVLHAAADACRRTDPSAAAAITGVPAEEIERAAHTLWASRPVAYYAWSGIEQHADATQIVRAVAQLYALTGSLDARGGNVLFPSVPTNAVDGAELLPEAQRRKALGVAERPLGPARFEFVTTDDFYTAALEAHPYRARALVSFGSNMVIAHPDSERGRRALSALDFYVHTDLFMNPSAQLADVVLPAASAFEAEGLRVGFDVSEDAQSLVQLRRPVAARRGEARSDVEIVFGIADRLGLGRHFWGGDVDAGHRHVLAPSGVELETLRAHPEGVRVPLVTRHRKFAEERDGVPRGFETPSRRIELYSETFLEQGYPPLPEFREPPMSPRARADLAQRYPLVLTSAKSTWYCESQQRGLPSLRRRAPDPVVELHPDTARARGVADGDWVSIATPGGSVRARAKLDADLDPGVVCGQHGWWQACEEIGAPAYPPYGDGSANLNLVLRHRPSDEVSGSPPLRSSLCEVKRLGVDDVATR
jgi:anaerobic selenocysteine-containing dehydrogenase